MVNIFDFKQLALSFPEATEEPHFEKISFRVRKKIFATYDPARKRACLKLTAVDQDVFSLASPGIIFPVDNKWGKQGWTLFEMAKVRRTIFADALTAAYKTVAPAKLVEQMGLL